MKIKVKKLHKDARVPKISTKDAACFDLYCTNEILMSQGVMQTAKCGIAVEIPTGYYIEIVPRSGISSRGIIIPNSPGIIDSDYRGEISVMLFGLFLRGREFFGKGSRIAQARLVKCEPTEFEVVNKLSDTKRGSGGFGSTGK